MNGAESLVKTLVENGIDVCFSNPGTSEMHFVAALDSEPRMRGVLCMFEGVCSGAADGYARIAGKPASTLLHLGSGLSNASANLHNAKKGNVPIVNIIGDHALRHHQYETPLRSDIKTLAAPVSHWVHAAPNAEGMSDDVAAAITAAGKRKIASLILPADVSWSDNADEGIKIAKLEPLPIANDNTIDEAHSKLTNGKKTVILVGGTITASLSQQLSQIAAATGAKICAETFPTRMYRGAGSGVLEKLPYLAEQAIAYLAEYQQIILLGANPPIAFFAYPGVPSELQAAGTDIISLAAPDHDVEATVVNLMKKMGDLPEPNCFPDQKLPLAEGELNSFTVCQSLANLLPDNAIIVDEGATSSLPLYPMTQTSAPHDWLTLTGGAIGFGLPCAVGAAVAAPDRKVVCLEGDGSAMYTIQALWTMAKENLDVCVIVFNNAKYNILELEFARTGAPGGKPGKKAGAMFDIGNPSVDFVSVAKSYGIYGVRCDSAESFNNALKEALAHKGPRVIEAMVPPFQLTP